MTTAEILEMLIALTPEQIAEMRDILGPCPGSVNLYNALMALQELK